MTDLDSSQRRLPRTGTLLVAVVVLVVATGVLKIWWPYHQEQQAIAEIEKNGGLISFIPDFPNGLPFSIACKYRGVFNRGMFRRAVGVQFSNKLVGDAALEDLQELSTKLEFLDFDNTQVSDAGLEHLSGMYNLESLHLNNTQVNGTGLENLQGLTNLYNLWLDKTQVSDSGLEHLEGLTNLDFLSLNKTQVSDAGLEHLRGLINLRVLSLEKNKITKAGVEKLQKALPKCRIEWSTSITPSYIKRHALQQKKKAAGSLPSIP